MLMLFIPVRGENRNAPYCTFRTSVERRSSICAPALCVSRPNSFICFFPPSAVLFCPFSGLLFTETFWWMESRFNSCSYLYFLLHSGSAFFYSSAISLALLVHRVDRKAQMVGLHPHVCVCMSVCFSFELLFFLPSSSSRRRSLSRGGTNHYQGKKL